MIYMPVILAPGQEAHHKFEVTLDRGGGWRAVILSSEAMGKNSHKARFGLQAKVSGQNLLIHFSIKNTEHMPFILVLSRQR